MRKMISAPGEFAPYRPASKAHRQAIRDGLKRMRLEKRLIKVTEELPLDDLERLIETAQIWIEAGRKIS